ncbi:hypothetical protein D9M68_58240 [compost metagenome]
MDEVLRRPGQHRLVPVRASHQRARVVRHQQLGHPVDEFHRADHSPDPVGSSLPPGGARVGVIRRAQHGDEDAGFEGNAAFRVQNRHHRAGEVRKQLLAGAVLLAHGPLECRCPVPVATAELRVLVNGDPWIRLQVFLPQQLQCHALAAQLAMQVGVVRRHPPARAVGRPLRAEQPLLQRILVQAVRLRPIQPRCLRHRRVLRNGANTHTRRPSDLPVRKATRPLQAKHFLDLAHGHPVGRHQLASLQKGNSVSPAF